MKYVAAFVLFTVLVCGCRQEQIVEELERYGVKREWIPFSPMEGVPADTNYSMTRVRETPEWTISQPTSLPFVFGITNSAKSGRSALKLSNTAEDPSAIWVWRNEPIDDMVGHKVRFSAYVRPENWDGIVMIGHGIWRKTYEVKIDTFKGTLPNGRWTRLSMEFDLPKEDGSLNFGLSFTGKGTISIDECSLEKIGISSHGSAPRTIAMIHRNLGFEDGMVGNVSNDPLDSTYVKIAPWKAYLDKREYDFETDSTITHTGNRSGVLRSVGSKFTASSLSLYDLQPELLQGYRVRFSVWLKAEDIRGIVSLSVSAYNTDTSVYKTRKLWELEGTSDWKQYSMEIDVPEGSQSLRIAQYLSGAGALYIDDLSFEKIGKLKTSPEFIDRSSYFAAPENLGFEGK